MPLTPLAEPGVQIAHAAGKSFRSRVTGGAALGAAAALLDTLPNGKRRGGILAALVEGAVLGAGSVVVGRLLSARRPEFQAGLRPHPSNESSHGGERTRRSAAPVQRRQRAIGQSGEGQHATPRAASDTLRKLYVGAGALSFSVVADSSLEHYRGGFYNRAMYIGPAVSALTLLAATTSAAGPRRRSGMRRAIFGSAAATGLIGTGFHIYNVSRREGGLGWLNLFYGAPIAAPMGITSAGLFGLAASHVASQPRTQPARLVGVRAGALLGSAAAMGLMGTAAEAGMLHFRGAFHDPFMYIPVTVPPLAALALGAAALGRDGAAHGGTRTVLWTTAAAGFVGMGFHAFGVHRNMGGWRNWTQNLLQGPPLPAPPSFTGMALAGLAALDLIEREAHG